MAGITMNSRSVNGSAAVDADIDALRDNIRGVLTREAGREQVLRVIADGALRDHALTAKAAELGWFALTIPEEHGGLGLGFSALAVLYEELGRFTAPLPCLGTMLVADALVLAGTSAQRANWLPRIAAGEVAGSVSARYEDQPLQLVGRGGDIILSGVIDDLIDPVDDGLLLIAAHDESGAPRHVLVEPGDGVDVQAQRMADQTRYLGDASLGQLVLPSERLLVDNVELRAALLTHAALAIACDAKGGATAVLDQTVDYLKLREQFGRPIGSFQALKHRCADHKVALEASGCVVNEAVRLHAAADPKAPLFASIAKFYACDVYATVATDAVQLHGGIGFTWEHACHLFLKRAKLDQALFGGSAAHADRAAGLLVAA